MADMWMKTEVLEKLLATLKKKGENGIALTIAINDESNEWGQNLSSFVSQTKEQREEGKPRFYTGNGKVFWTDGKVEKAVKKEEAPSQQNTEDDEDPF